MTGWAVVAAGCAGAATLPTRTSPARRAAVATRRATGGGGALLPAAAVVVTAGVAAACSSIFVVAAAGLSWLVATLVRRGRVARLRQERASACVELVFALAAELRAGRPPAEALRAAGRCVAPLSTEIEQAAAEVLAAGDAAGVLERLARVPGCGALRAVAAAWSVTERAGGPVADVLDRLGESLDATADVERTMQAALAGPRSTVVLLAFLPLLGIALGQSIGANPLTLLLHRPVGWALSGVAMLLELAGVMWTRTIVGRVAK
jgi:tight adherence protein B